MTAHADIVDDVARPLRSTRPSRIGRGGEIVLNIVVGGSLLANVVIVFASVIGRAFSHPLVWAGESVQLGLIVMAFLGAAIAYIHGQHPRIDILVARLPARARRIQECAADWIVVAIALWLAVASARLALASVDGATSVLGISPSWSVLPMTLGMACVVVYGVGRILSRDRMRGAVVGIVIALVVVLAASTHSLWEPIADQNGIAFALVIGVVLVLGGVPLGFVFGFVALFYAYGPGVVDVVQVPISMKSGVTNIVLVAIPFFIFAGLIMDRGGVTRRLVRFLRSLIGGFRGGLYYAEILGMFVFSGISGSKSADVAAIGSALTDSLRKEGYDENESVALLASGAAMGETIPPSVAMLVLGSISTVSIASLFLGGIAPAVIMAVGLIVVVAFRVRASDLERGAKASLREVGISAALALPSLAMLVILFGGILLGIGTPEEVSSFAVVYGLLLAFLVNRELTFRQLWDVVIKTVSLSGMILFIVSTANAFASMMTINQIPQGIASLIIGFGGGAAVFLLITIVVMIIAGMLFEGLPALIVFTPLLFPVALELGISPLTYGIVLIISMGIGGFSPPVGVGFFVAVQVGGAQVGAAARRMLWYIPVLLIGAVLTAFIPWLTIALPQFFGL